MPSTSLTRWARGAAAVAAVVAGAAWLASGGAVFSPGRLHAGGEEARSIGGVRSHAELSRSCGACHAPPLGAERMADRCLACHAEIRAELGDTAALHGMLPDARRCLACHVEHEGPRGVLTEFTGEGFPHERLGFSLAAHRETADGLPFTCSGCHGGGTFRFAEAACEQCHREYQARFIALHVRDWGRVCRDCHEGTDRFSAFRHDTTAYRLVGKHVETGCVECHADVRTFAAFAAAPTTCVGCHSDDDEHRGRYGTDCGACHNPAAWDDVDFDHTFPLDHGGEGAVACATCHADMPGFRTYTCYGCHEHRPAEIRREHLEEGITEFRQCIECHPTGTEGEAERRRRRDNRRDDDAGRGRGRGGRG